MTSALSTPRSDSFDFASQPTPTFYDMDINMDMRAEDFQLFASDDAIKSCIASVPKSSGFDFGVGLGHQQHLPESPADMNNYSEDCASLSSGSALSPTSSEEPAAPVLVNASASVSVPPDAAGMYFDPSISMKVAQLCDPMANMFVDHQTTPDLFVPELSTSSPSEAGDSDNMSNPFNMRTGEDPGNIMLFNDEYDEWSSLHDAEFEGLKPPHF